MNKNNKKNNLNPVFAPYYLPIEDIETLGNYQLCELFDEIKCFSIPPYSLTVDKDKVPEMNLEPSNNDKLFYMEFKYE